MSRCCCAKPIPSGPPWTLWFPVAVAGTPNDWELRRFEEVTELGTPKGESLVATDARGAVRIFHSEFAAAHAAEAMNRDLIRAATRAPRAVA